MSTLDWSDLGPPTTPGNIQIKGLGVVVVTQENIDDANGAGGDVDFDLIEITALGDKTHRYMLGLMR